MSKRLGHKAAVIARARPASPARSGRARAHPFHAFLKRLRAGGRTNMYGAVPYLMRAFALDRDTAFRVVCEWLDQQDEASGGEREASSSR